MKQNMETELSIVGNFTKAGGPAAASPRGEIYNIQILRFIAAAMVLISHVQHEVLTRPSIDSFSFHPFEPVWWAGGVDVFFVISGFIMCYISRGAFAKPNASLEFILRRLVRLVPLYWAVTTAMLFAVLFVPGELSHSETNFVHILTSYLFIPSRNAYGGAFPLYIGGWTLNYEMLFYAVFSIALFFRRSLGLVFVFAALTALALLSLAGPLPVVLSFWSDPIIINFTYGVVVAILYERGVRFTRPVGAAIAVLGILLMMASQVLDWYQVYALRFLWAGFPAALLVLGMTLVPDHKQPGRFKRWLAFGGDCSYSLYLTHPFFLGIVAILYRHSGLANPWLYVVAAFWISMAGAAAVYVFAERPAYKLLSAGLRHWLVTRRPPSPQAA